MSDLTLLPVRPDWNGFLANLRRAGTPDRVYCFEHGIADNVLAGVDERFGITAATAPSSPAADWDRRAAIHRYLGHELFRAFPQNARFTVAGRAGGWTEESRGPVTTWEEFEAYPWPDPREADYRMLEHYDGTLEADMRVFHVLDFWEKAKDLLGFETLCLTLYDQPDLVEAVFQRVGEYVEAIIATLCDFTCVGAIYIADDLGFKTSTFLPPDDLRRLVLPWHKRYCAIAHAHGKLFILHSCGQMYDLMDAYIDEIGIDAKHSFEEAVLPVTEVKQRYGDRVALLGGMDVDLLARADEATIRAKTRAILDTCLPGGGYCLGSGNWVSSYIPLDNYLIFLDEARRLP